MSDRLVCPVCRAGQPHQSACRRCGADLQLLVRTLRAVAITREKLSQTLQTGASPETFAALQKRLRWLAPNTVTSDGTGN